MKRYHQLTGGMGLLEAVVSIAIMVGVILILLNIFNNLLLIADDNVEFLQAESLLSEGAEVVRLWRDDSWANLSTLTVGTDYFYKLNGNTWATSTVNTFVDSKYDRRFVLADVSRNDLDDDISSSGGSLDPDTKLVTVSVAWFNRVATTTKTVSFYLTNILE